MLIKIPIIANETSRDVPPLLTKGNGTPVTGNKPTTTPILTNA